MSRRPFERYSRWVYTGHYVDPRTPCAWEELLRSLGVRERGHTARELAEMPGVAEWVRRYHASRFVPERVLAVLGLQVSDL